MLRKGLFRKPENKLEILSEAPGTAKAAGEEGSFSVCRACGAATPDGELASALGVCPKCGRYAPLGARARSDVSYMRPPTALCAPWCEGPHIDDGRPWQL